MRRSFLVLVTVLALALGSSTVALADPEGVQSTGVSAPDVLALITDDDVFSTADLSLLLSPVTPLATSSRRTQHYGPYESTSPDSGTCGNEWATDFFDRHFTVRANGDGTFTVVQQFKRGSFVSNATATAASPGACDSSDGKGPGTLVPGKTGSMHGYFIISNVGPQTSDSPFCDAAAMTNDDCTTTTFINTHFAPCYPVTCTVGTYFFHYAAGNQDLIEHEWKNASCDRGGNHGDIQSAGAVFTELPTCP